MKKKLTLIAIALLIIFQNNLIAQYDEERVRISGFMDFDCYKIDFDDFNRSPGNALPQIHENTSYIQNSLNLYFNFKVDEGWKAFTEIRFLYLPTGQYQYTTSATTATVTYYNGNGTDPMLSPIQYGSIYIERSYIEWNQLSFFNLRFGRYFTPYGIWSNDHGSPAVTSVRFPYFVCPISQGVYGMPLKQTGIEALGNIPISNAILQYALYTGNGQSNAEAIGDHLDDNKSIGGFLNLKLPTFADIDIEIGCSGYRGRKVILNDKKVAAAASLVEGTVDTYEIMYVALTEENAQTTYLQKEWDNNALAHLKATVSNLPFEGTFVIQGEYMKQWIYPDKDNRIQDLALTALNGTPLAGGKNLNLVLQENYINDIYYVQAEYQFFGRLTPYARYEHFETTTLIPIQLFQYDELNIYVIGLNFKPVPKVVIKAEYDRSVITSPLYMKGKGTINNSSNGYFAQIAVAF